jgi:preprotein translocase subunit SecE
MAVVTNPPTEAPAPGRVQGVIGFYHGVVAELRKVTWPDVGQVRQATILIIIVVLVLAALISILDLILNGILVRMIPSLFRGGAG